MQTKETRNNRSTANDREKKRLCHGVQYAHTCGCVVVTRQRALVNKTLKLSLWNSIYFHFKSFDMWALLFLYRSPSLISFSHLRLAESSFEIIVTVLLFVILKRSDHHENNRQLLKGVWPVSKESPWSLFICQMFFIPFLTLLFFLRNFHLFNYYSSHSWRKENRLLLLWFLIYTTECLV